MTERDKGLVAAFKKREEERGIRSTRKIPYYLAVFFDWLEESGFELADVNARKAEVYQTYLVTKEKDGAVHYASRTVADMVKTADRFFSYLVTLGRMRNNPFYGMPKVKMENSLPRNIPTPDKIEASLEELRRFWSAQKIGEKRNHYKVHVMAEVLYSTGMRIDELARLEVSDIDWRGNMVRIREGKGGVERMAYLNEYAREVLRLYVEEMRALVNSNRETQNLFGVANGKALEGTINEWLKRTCGITSHTFRHCVGTHLLQKGCDLRFIQLILGHEDLKSTALYTKISKDDLRDQLDLYHPRR